MLGGGPLGGGGFGEFPCVITETRSSWRLDGGGPSVERADDVVVRPDDMVVVRPDDTVVVHGRRPRAAPRNAHRRPTGPLMKTARKCTRGASAASSSRVY